MNFEALQKLWSEQTSGRVELPARAELFARVKKESREFDAMIAKRDRAELGTGAVLIAVFTGSGLVYGRSAGVAWPFYAAAVCMLWVFAFFVVEKRLARRHRPSNTEPLRGALDAAISHVRRQLWMLRNVMWWYLLPAQTGWFLFFLGILLTPAFPRWFALAALPLVLWYLWRMSVSVYALNKEAISKDLEPRYEELTRLRDALVSAGDEPGGDSGNGL